MGKRVTAGQSGPAGKRVRVVTETVEERDETDAELDLDTIESVSAGESADADALQELYELDGGSGARFEVRRTAPAEFVGYIGTFSRDSFSLDALSELWGGGNFTIRVRGTGGNYVGSKTITVAGKAKHKTEASAAPPVASQGNGELAGVLTAMQKNSEAQMTMMMGLLTAVLSKPAPVAPPPPDPLAMIAALKEVLAPPKTDNSGDSIKLLLQGLELGKEIAGGGDGEPGMGKMFLEGMSAVKTLAANAPKPAPATGEPLRRIAPPAAAPADAPAQLPPPAESVAAPQKETDPMLKKLQWITGQCAGLVKLAKLKKDPELYAEVFLDNLPPFITLEEIAAQMDDAGALDNLAMVNAEVNNHREWFEAFRVAVVSQLTDDGESEADPLPHDGEPDPMDVAHDANADEFRGDE